MAEWQTSDLYLAAFLDASGHPMLRFEKKEIQPGKPKTIFYFEAKPELDKIKFDYHSNKASVLAFAFVTKVKAFKSLIYS